MGWGSAAAYALSGGLGAGYLVLINHEGADRSTLWTFFFPTWWAVALLAAALLCFVLGSVLAAMTVKRNRGARATAHTPGTNDTSTPSERTRVPSPGEVKEYLRRLDARLGRDLPQLVELPIVVRGETRTSDELYGLLNEIAKVAVVAPSGAGKSHLARHLARRSIADGRVVIWLSFDEYERGRLDLSLSTAVSPFTPTPPLSLLGAATGEPLIIVDAVDNAPHTLQHAFFDQLAVLGRTTRLSVLVTSTKRIAEDEFLHAQLLAPTATEISGLRQAHGIPDDAALPDAFSSPFQIAIASQCLMDLSDDASAAELLDTYIRRLAPSERVRSALRAIAASMTESVKTVLTLSDVRAIVRRLTDLDSQTIHLVTDSPLLTIERERVRFSHEQIQKFVAAEAVVLRSSSGQSLGLSLLKAHHRDLIDFALYIERDTVARLGALETIADSTRIVQALNGHLGPTLASQVETRLDELVATATAVIAESELLGSDTDGVVRWKSAREWTEVDVAYLTAAGTVATDAEGLGRILALIDATDEHLELQIRELQQTGERRAITRSVEQTYAHLWGPAARAVAAAIVTTGLRTELVRCWRRTGGGLLPMLLADAGTTSWGRLYIASLVCEYGVLGTDDLELIPKLLETAWAAGGYHLRLQVLMAVQRCAHVLEGDDRRAAIDVLHGIATDDLILSSQLVEALAAYGQVEPIRSLEEIRSEIRDVLAAAPDSDASTSAAGLVSGMFELEDIVGPYSEAFHELASTDRLRLLGLAAHAKPSTFHIDWIMSELADAANVDTPISVRAIQSVAGMAPWDDPLPQSVTLAHLHALRGAARLGVWTPADIRSAGDERAVAWATMDAILVEGVFGESSDVDFEERWRVLVEEVPRATVGVLVEIHGAQATSGEWQPHTLLLQRFPEQIRTLLSWALRNFDPSDRIPRLFETPTDYAIQMLGHVGDAASADALRRLALDEKTGDQAVRAIRLIETRVSQS